MFLFYAELWFDVAEGHMHIAHSTIVFALLMETDASNAERPENVRWQFNFTETIDLKRSLKMMASSISISCVTSDRAFCVFCLIVFFLIIRRYQFPQSNSRQNWTISNWPSM